MRTLSVIAMSAALCACAPTPESIQPAYVSDVPFQSWSCQQLGEETLRLNSALATASQQQSTARSNDIAGVILLGLPVASMSGQSIAPQIARYKGEQEAVHRAMRFKGCAELYQPQPPAPPPAPVNTKTSRAPTD